ncbi:phosphotransferase enzyme family protein [Viridothelium virens]|uniref:Altered inheritance of mitochondria protein 9, mitochondrial n=1 Tax=Viridothelium virens TaxID=1048519 RepID=A0A6A6HQT9_VIRVR|nr:phosphotransferase enzyme family protein [Viridothelium virens]
MSFFVRSAFNSQTYLANTTILPLRMNRLRQRLSSTSRPAAAGASAPPVDCDVEKFYSYTSGRWLWNEKQQFERRYVKFNLPELLNVAARATGARRCVEVQKLPEGNFSKAFLITMDDGQQIIAKLPIPNAGRSHYTTASEAATMDYVRNILQIPAPNVLAWSSSRDNPVAAEYILMERSRGVELGKIWDEVSWEDRLQIVESLVSYEKAFVSANLPMYGSIYYAKDLKNLKSSQLVQTGGLDNQEKSFAIGPTTNRAFFDDGRDSVEVNRGPWPSLEEYIFSRADREFACLDKFSTYPSQQGLTNGPHLYHPTKTFKLEVLQNYMKVASRILANDPGLSKAVLWHSDLHADNIFVDPNQPTKILDIIDWQAVNVSPPFLQARHPSLINFEGPIPEGFDPILLPDNFEQLSKEEQQQAKNLRAAQSIYKLYEIQMLGECPEIARALRYRESLLGQITGIASSVASDGEVILQGMLIQLHDNWSECIGSSTPCPLTFSANDRTQQAELQAKWSEGVELMHDLLTDIGAYQGWDGWVNHDNYEIYKERLARCREEFFNRHAATEGEKRQWAQAWPFEDKPDL